MKESAYKSYGELPLFLNARLAAQVMGISLSSGYALLHQQNCPTPKIGNRIVVPTGKFLQWVERNTGGRWRLMLWQYAKQDAVKNFSNRAVIRRAGSLFLSALLWGPKGLPVLPALCRHRQISEHERPTQCGSTWPNWWNLGSICLIVFASVQDDLIFHARCLLIGTSKSRRRPASSDTVLSYSPQVGHGC